jgi:hypothetical protein
VNPVVSAPFLPSGDQGRIGESKYVRENRRNRKNSLSLLWAKIANIRLPREMHIAIIGRITLGAVILLIIRTNVQNRQGASTSRNSRSFATSWCGQTIRRNKLPTRGTAPRSSGLVDKLFIG